VDGSYPVMKTKLGTKSPRRALRYAAKLLFQFRVVVNGHSGVRRRCEERIIIFCSTSARAALSAAKKRGRSGQIRYKNSDGNPVFFEFIGVLDLLQLGLECEEDEVWYDIVERVRPMERRARLIPLPKKLDAFRSQRSQPGSAPHQAVPSAELER
jgi:hypothetical protein